jgi:hypothetical protein
MDSGQQHQEVRPGEALIPAALPHPTIQPGAQQQPSLFLLSSNQLPSNLPQIQVKYKKKRRRKKSAKLQSLMHLSELEETVADEGLGGQRRGLLRQLERSVPDRPGHCTPPLLFHHIIHLHVHTYKHTYIR